MQEFDYIILGAGTAGCGLANRLSADPYTRVLLLEAGGKDDYFWIQVPIGYLYTIGNPRTDWCFKTEPDPGLNGRSIGYARGKVLGGCSSINAMIYMRGQRSDYDHWAAQGLRGWSWDDVLPVFKRSEDYQHGADEFHGAGGELRVEERRVDWGNLDAGREAAGECRITQIAEVYRSDHLCQGHFPMKHPLDLQGAQHGHAESARGDMAWPSAHGARVRAVPYGAAHDAAVAARCVREERPRPTAREHRMARAAVVARQVRLAAAQVRCDYAVRLQPAAHESRPRADQERGSASRA